MAYGSGDIGTLELRHVAPSADIQVGDILITSGLDGVYPAGLAVAKVTKPERYFLLAATGDEVLDYRDMVEHYAGARQHVIEGSDHAIAEFPDYVDEVLAFCGIDVTEAAR